MSERKILVAKSLKQFWRNTILKYKPRNDKFEKKNSEQGNSGNNKNGEGTSEH